jgi:hypothetical protein
MAWSTTEFEVRFSSGVTWNRGGSWTDQSTRYVRTWCCTYLTYQMLKRWRWGVEAVEVCVQCEFCESFPGRLVRLHLDWVDAQGALVTNWTRRHHRDSLHAPVSQLPSVLQQSYETTIRTRGRIFHLLQTLWRLQIRRNLILLAYMLLWSNSCFQNVTSLSVPVWVSAL